MKCPNCGNELKEGNLLCEHCGEEVKIVPDFDIELEDKLKESISDMLQDMAAEELIQNESRQESEEDIINEPSAYFPTESKSVRKLRIIIIVLMLMILVAVIITFTIHSVNDQRYHSFDYQYNKATA